jgi:hypothetical protein
MPKRSREEKLAAYSKGAKRGYRARKAFVKTNGLEMKTAPPGEVEPSLIGDLRGIAAGRALGNAGPMEAIQIQELRNHEAYTNADESQQPY